MPSVGHTARRRNLWVVTGLAGDATLASTVRLAAAGDGMAFARTSASFHDDMLRVAYVVGGDGFVVAETVLKPEARTEAAGYRGPIGSLWTSHDGGTWRQSLMTDPVDDCFGHASVNATTGGLCVSGVWLMDYSTHETAEATWFLPGGRLADSAVGFPGRPQVPLGNASTRAADEPPDLQRGAPTSVRRAIT